MTKHLGAHVQLCACHIDRCTSVTSGASQRTSGFPNLAQFAQHRNLGLVCEISLQRTYAEHCWTIPFSVSNTVGMFPSHHEQRTFAVPSWQLTVMVQAMFTRWPGNYLWGQSSSKCSLHLVAKKNLQPQSCVANQRCPRQVTWVNPVLKPSFFDKVYSSPGCKQMVYGCGFIVFPDLKPKTAMHQPAKLRTRRRCAQG